MPKRRSRSNKGKYRRKKMKGGSKYQGKISRMLPSQQPMRLRGKGEVLFLRVKS